MITKSEERKSDLRNTTVLEVIIAVIIVLMLVVYSVNTKNEKLNDEKTSLEQIYRKEIEQLKKDLKKANTKIVELNILNSRLKRKIKEQDEEIKMLKANISRGVSGAQILNDEIDELKEKIKKLENQIDELKLRIKLLLTDPSEDELDKKIYGPIIVQNKSYKDIKGRKVFYVLNQENKKLILSINCDTNELDVRIPGRKWMGSKPAKEEFENNLINDFC